MTRIPKDHPRYLSLITRECIICGMESGITSIQGLIAHGRGEAFDYLIGEVTLLSALEAQRAAAAVLLLAQRPVISINGNAAVLVPQGLVELSKIAGAPIEVNLFHKTQDRVLKTIEYLQSYGAIEVLGATPDAVIPGLSSKRAQMCSNGIGSADVVFVPLEDGDRCEALIKMGKLIITVDLNPLSRTSKTATVTIVDNIIRAVPNIIEIVKDLKERPEEYLYKIKNDFNNKAGIDDALGSICRNLPVHDAIDREK